MALVFITISTHIQMYLSTVSYTFGVLILRCPELISLKPQHECNFISHCLCFFHFFFFKLFSSGVGLPLFYFFYCHFSFMFLSHLFPSAIAQHTWVCGVQPIQPSGLQQLQTGREPKQQQSGNGMNVQSEISKFVGSDSREKYNL